MKKRIAKIVGVVLALMLTLLPVTALAADGDVAQVGDTTYATLQEAVANANGQTVTLLASVSDQPTIGITDGNAVTIDLNGHDIGFAQQKHFLVSNGSLTLTGTGTVAEQSPYFGAVVIKGSTTDVADYSNFVCGEGVTLSGWSPVFIDQNAQHAFGVNVTVNGTLKSVRDTSGELGNGVYINGQSQDLEVNVPKITLNGKIESEGNGIYAAGYAEWTMNCDIDAGLDALSIKCGTFDFVGGRYVSHGEYVDPAEANGNGSEQTGAALSVTTNRGYAKKTVIRVAGGEFISENGHAVYEGIAKKNDGTPAADASIAQITISDGSFFGASDKDAVKFDTMVDKDTISGGTYTTPVPAEYIAPELASLVLNTADADRYTVVPEAEAEARAMAIVTKADGSKIYYENRDAAQEALTDDATVEYYYMVTFRDGETVLATQRVKENAPAAKIDDPKQAGKNFVRWQAEGTDKAYDFSTPVTQDLILNAVWTDIPKTGDAGMILMIAAVTAMVALCIGGVVKIKRAVR